jgi:heme oxygenase-like protein
MLGASDDPKDSGFMTPKRSRTALIQAHVDCAIDDLRASLPNPAQLSSDERRGIIARYTAVLEGNFIYWMTAAYLSVASEEAQSVIQDNLREEVRDNHPGMLRKFAIAAHAVPTDSDARAVHRNLQNVRLFVARLSGVKIVLMMAFFEGFITRFMPYLAELAKRQGSTEYEYTEVHGVVDLVHTQALFRALDAELRRMHTPPRSATKLLEGVKLLRTLIQTIIQNSDDRSSPDGRSRARSAWRGGDREADPPQAPAAATNEMAESVHGNTQ